MPMSTATQEQVAALAADSGRVAPELRRSVDGSTQYPLRAEDRIPLINKLSAVTQDLKVLGFIDDTPTLGPNDIIIDKTLPVPVRDLDTGVSGTAHVSIVDGNPIVGFTGEAVSLVRDGGGCLTDNILQKKTHTGTLTVGDGVKWKPAPDVMTVQTGDYVMLQAYGGGGTNLALKAVGISGSPAETYGGWLQIEMGEYGGYVNKRASFYLRPADGSASIETKVRDTSNLIVSSAEIPADIAVVKHGATIAVAGGISVKASVVAGVLTLTPA